MWSPLRLVACLALGAAAAGPALSASAEIAFVSQERRVRATLDGQLVCQSGCTSGPIVGQQETISPHFAEFDATAAAQSANATQSSSIGASRLAAQGAIHAPGVFQILFGGQAFATADTTARSEFEVSFDVGAAVSFVLDGTLGWSVSGFSGLTQRIELRGPSGLVARIDCAPTGPPPASCGPFSDQITGVLEKGRYTLEAVVAGNGAAGTLGGPPSSTVDASYSMSLALEPVVPVPGLGPAGGLALGALLAWLGVRLGPVRLGAARSATR